MDVVSTKARNGLPSELRYVDDLVIMAPTMEQWWEDDCKQWWEDDCKLWKVVSVGKEYRQTLFSAQYVKMDS